MTCAVLSCFFFVSLCVSGARTARERLGTVTMRAVASEKEKRREKAASSPPCMPSVGEGHS